jgi:Holliday junction resolvasome RuvABC ATP-dependent DNA helicase subunit
MNAIYMTDIFLIILIAVLVVIISIISYRRFRTKYLRSQNDSLVAPKEHLSQHQAIFVDLSPKSADIVELAVEVWRINNRIMKAGNDLSEIQKRGLESSLQKFIKFLDSHDIKIVDHAGEKYNEGMNIDVISFTKDQNVKTPLIKETIEPSIICKGYVIKKGKVIVVNN